MWCVGGTDQGVHRQHGGPIQAVREAAIREWPVVCVDEKPTVLHEDTGPPIPMNPGQVAPEASGATQTGMSRRLAVWGLCCFPKNLGQTMLDLAQRPRRVFASQNTVCTLRDTATIEFL